MSSTSDRSRLTEQADLQTLAVTQQRVLRVLGMSRRPLQSGELQNALGLVPNETHSVCEWLTDRGYINTVRAAGRAAQKTTKLWSLADKGRSWAKGQGALVPQDA
jgi:predicted ArsR family transcriptional regulator